MLNWIKKPREAQVIAARNYRSGDLAWYLGWEKGTPALSRTENGGYPSETLSTMRAREFCHAIKANKYVVLPLQTRQFHAFTGDFIVSLRIPASTGNGATIEFPRILTSILQWWKQEVNLVIILSQKVRINLDRHHRPSLFPFSSWEFRGYPNLAYKWFILRLTLPRIISTLAAQNLYLLHQ